MGNTVSVWVALLLGLAPALVAALAIVAAEVRDRRRLIHERESRLRDERIAAYRKLLAATAGLPTERKDVVEVGQALMEVQLLAEDLELIGAGAELYEKYGNEYSESKEWDEQSAIRASSEIGDRRVQFLSLAREELGITGSWE